MLTIPAFAEIEGLTVFRDDVEPSRFYYLPRSPRISLAANGQPMFTFLRYQFPIDRGTGEPGGGYLVFTTAMREDSAVLDAKVRPALEQRLRAEQPTATAVPAVALAPVAFTAGEARLIIMQNNQIVKALGLGKPSLFGDNTASVAVELSADGATLFYEALRQGGSVAAIEYDLQFPVRLPAITIVGHVDAKEVKQAAMTFSVEKVTKDSWNPLRPSTTTSVPHRASIAETMESQGLVRLEIIKGDVDLEEDDLEAVRAFAFRTMDEFIKEHFLKGGSVETEEDRKSAWMQFLGSDITGRFDLSVSYRDVISRAYSPSAQINPSFLGAQIDRLVTDIDLGNAPWYFNNLAVTVDTNLDFARYGDLVHSVVGHLTYDQVRPDGTRLTERASVAFTAADRAPKTFRTRLAAVGRDTYHVAVEVNYKGGPTLQATVGRFDTTTRNLTLDVPNPGVLEVHFATAPKAFEAQLAAVEVEVEYGDPRHRVPRTVETVLLNAERPEADYRRAIYAPLEQPYRHRYTYVLRDADGSTQRSTTDWREAAGDTRFVNVPTPFDEQFSLTVLPSVDWSEVRECVVDLEYLDAGGDYRQAQTFSFSRDVAGPKTWKFPLRSPRQRGYRFRQTLLLANSAAEEGPWQARESDAQSLVVGNAPGGVVTIEVDPSDAALGTEVRRLIVRLRYAEPASNWLDSATLLFRDATPQTWTIARRDPTRSQYAYDVEYFLADGSRRTLADQSGTISAPRDFLFVPAPPAAS